MVLNGANAVPVESARIRLYAPPVDPTPEYEIQTDGFGLFAIKDIVPREYRLVVEHPGYVRYETNLVTAAGAITNRMIRLTPIDGKIVFDIFFQAFCLSTHAALSGGKITAEFWRPGGTLSGPPDAIVAGVLDQFGAATLTAVEDGFYKFRAERTGWETLNYVPPANSGFILAGDKVRLTKAYYGSVFLRPIKTSLKVTAQGFDPVKNQPNQPLKGMAIHLTGLDLMNNNITLVPTVTGISGDDGSFKFANLAPIRWKVEVARLGYKVKSVIVAPNANGTLPDQLVDLELEPTKLRVRATSPYRTTDAVKGTTIQVRGIQASNTEGISREAMAQPDATNHTASALFENLLPGRYWIHLKQEATISGLPANSGVLRGPTSFRVSFFPKESYAEADMALTTDTQVALEPVPAVIRGRLMATDQLGNVLIERSNPEPNRIWRKMQHAGITFLEHKLIKLLSDTNNSVVVDADEAGNFTALVPPGIFGVQIPTMTTHTGHNIEIGDLTAAGLPRTGPWPYADIWPHTTFEGGHHGAGLAFDSRHEYLLNLFVHRNYINICGTIASPTVPFFDLVLTMDRDGSNVQSYRYNHLFDVGAEVIADGPRRYTGRVLEDNSYVIQNMAPGTYTLRVDHPQYTMPPKTITIAPWNPPGIIPSTAPLAPGYYFPGITHLGAEFTLNPDWIAKGTINIRQFDWVTGDFPDYLTSGGGPPSYFRMEGLPNRLFRYARNLPAPSYTIWRLYGQDWFTGSSSAMPFEAYIGGPKDNTSPNNAPADRTAYTLDLRAYSVEDRHFAISNVVVQFAGSTQTRIAGSEVPWDGRPQVQTATHPQWTYSSYETKLLNADTRLVQINVFMRRAALVTVTVDSKNGRVPNAAVVLRNRYGNPVRQGITSTNGTVSFTAVTPQVMYLEVTRRGYIPQRKSYVPALENPDVNANFTLEEVPSPTIDLFTMNRFGIFLPGVSRSADATGFNPQNAAPSLTVTWKAEARGTNYNVSLEGFRQPDETPGAPEVSEVVDRVAELWVIDRRAFTNAFVNNLNQNVFLDNFPPSVLNYVNVSKWLESITTARKDNQPYYVVHQNKVRGERSGFNKFEGDFKVWELPSGVFRPILLAITEGGGVAVKDYDLPDKAGKPGEKEDYLQGFNLPTWAANLLDIVGVAANLPEGQTDLHNRFGDGFMKIGTFSPKAEARIGLDPSTNTPAVNSYLTYKYVIGIELPLGEATAETGPMNMGPKFLGLKFTGASAEFEVIGKDRKAGLAVNLGAAPAEDVKRRDKDYHPVLSEGAEEDPGSPFEVEPEFSGKFAILETLEPDWRGRNRVSTFGYGLEAQGKVDVTARFNATPVIGKIPYVGPVLFTLDKSGLMTVYAQIEGTLGMKVNVEAMTTFPVYGATTTSLPPQRWDPLGGTTVKLEVKMFLRVAGGLVVSALGGRAEATALIQVGAPSNAPDLDGVFFTIDPLGKGNLLTKIEGALSVVLRAQLNLLTINVSKQMQWDIARFVIDRSSEPSFELTPLNISYFVTSPITSLPQAFNGKQTNIIENFYARGSLDLATGASPLLVFTGIDSAGKMTVMASFQSGANWSAPVQLGSAPGIISVAVTEQPTGGYMVVWSEVPEADMGSAFPASTIKFVRSNPNGTWSPAAVISTESAALTDLNLIRSGTQVLLLYAAEAEGPQGPKTLRSTLWDGSAWTSGQILLAGGEIQNYDAAGDPAGGALAVASKATGELVSLRWNGSAWTDEGSIRTNAGSALSIALDGANGVLASIGQDNHLEMSKFDSGTRQWSKLLTVSTNALGRDCEVAVLTHGGETLYLVAWISGAEKSSLFYSIITRTGVIRVPPTEITPGSQGTFARLKLRALPEHRASLMASYTAGEKTYVREYTLGITSAQDCDGDGIADALAIASGLVADCNRNGIPDVCDLRSGHAVDRDGDGLLDECQPAVPDDCNRNGVSDRYELSLGIGDANRNGVLDECESGVLIKVVPFPANTRETYYRAPALRIKSRTATSLELEFRGRLEKADKVQGPWAPVP
jgi:hypothetical protein